MPNLLEKFRSAGRRGQKGFTLIEMLIVTAILGILAGIAVPNVGGMIKNGSLNAANTELSNVEVASVGYYGANGKWPADSDSIGSFLQGSPKANYIFDSTTGYVVDVSRVQWAGIRWSTPSSPYSRHGEWVK